MVPCPWARRAAAQLSGETSGFGSRLTAEHSLYRWPITQRRPVPARRRRRVPAQRTRRLGPCRPPTKVRREARAQSIGRSLGFDVSHLDTAPLDDAAAARVLRRLPRPRRRVRAAHRHVRRHRRIPHRLPGARSPPEAGVLFPDQTSGRPASTPASCSSSLGSLGPGVHRAAPAPRRRLAELRSITTSWGARWTTTQSSARRTPCATRCSTQASPSLATGRCARRSAGPDQPAQLGAPPAASRRPRRRRGRPLPRRRPDATARQR